MSTSSSARGASGRATVMAWLISGSESGNTASMTTPWISSIRPTLRFSVVTDIAFSSYLRSERSRSRLAQALGTGDDFHDLLRDLSLAGTVHLQGQVLDQLAGVVGRVA